MSAEDENTQPTQQPEETSPATNEQQAETTQPESTEESTAATTEQPKADGEPADQDKKSDSPSEKEIPMLEEEEPAKKEDEEKPANSETENGNGDVGKEEDKAAMDGMGTVVADSPEPEKTSEKKEAAAAEGDEEEKTIDKNDPESYCSGMADTIERKNMETYNGVFGGAEGLAELFGSDIKTGLKADQVDGLRAKYGKNELPKKDPVTFMEFLIEAFQDGIIQMLCVAAVISIIFGLTLENPHSGKVDRETGWIEGFAIIISVAVVTLMGSINNYEKAKKFEEMENETNQRDVTVIRDGGQEIIDSTLVVVGDVLEVESGIAFTCDAVMISGTDLKSNESAMTGEPDLIKKSIEKDPFFISGTTLDDGAGRLLVVAVGTKSQQGVLKEALSEEQADTPLQQHLAKLADDIGKIGAVMAGLLLGGLILKEIILIAAYDKTPSAPTFLRFVIVAITIIVVAIPEGLPLAVTISLAFSMKAMMKDNCLVRILASCETMGGATAICSDKTGTLTENRMTVVQGYIFGAEFVIDGYALHLRNGDTITVPREADFESSTGGLPISAEVLNEFCFALAVNSSARQEKNKQTGDLEWVGNKTEHGLLGFCNFAKRDYNKDRLTVEDENKKQFPFNSAKKRMTTVIRGHQSSFVQGSGGDSLTSFNKGASELILDDCTRYFDRNGQICDLDEDKRQDFLAIIESMANQGNRTIGLSLRPLDGTNMPEEEPLDNDCVFMGVMGIQDPIRKEVPQAVDDCESAGIRVRMVTGDNINTAIAIAKKAHIYSDPTWDMAMTGVDFRNKYDNDKDSLYEILPRLRVLARSSPTDKHKLVGMLQDIGEVVGVTGDGTNDAPALKLANVGFAMNTGTDIAKGAADMVLLDDNFASVINATMWGRAVNDNIRKFIQYQLSINIGGVLLTVVSALASPTSKEVFSPVMLLWLNLIMDTMAALALATEKPERNSLKRDPVFKQAPLLSNKMRSFMGIHASFQTLIILLLLFLGHNWFQTIEEEEHCSDFFYNDMQRVNASNPDDLSMEPTTHNRFCTEACEHHGGVLDGRFCQQGNVHGALMFNVYIWMQAFNIFNARRLYNEFNLFDGLFTRSQPLCAIFWVIAIFQVIAIFFFGSFMGTEPLGWELWLVSIGIGLVEIPLGIIVRLLPITDFVPEAVTAKQARENTLRERVREHQHSEGQGTLLTKRDPSLKRTMSMSKNSGGVGPRRKSFQ